MRGTIRATANAIREAFRFDGLPVEAFVHDPDTLNYFFMELDRPSGIPALPQMVLEGVEIPDANDTSRILKQRAAAVIEMGPPALSSEEERKLRYAITDLIEDLREPGSSEERLGTGAKLFEEVANYYLRSNGLWSAKAKTIPRTLARADAGLAARYCQSFERLFKRDDAEDVIQITEELLRPAGGFLFEGYRSDAPTAWRRAPENVNSRGDPGNVPPNVRPQ